VADVASDDAEGQTGERIGEGGEGGFAAVDEGGFLDEVAGG
jgi:hypothetical protein